MAILIAEERQKRNLEKLTNSRPLKFLDIIFVPSSIIRLLRKTEKYGIKISQKDYAYFTAIEALRVAAYFAPFIPSLFS